MTEYSVISDRKVFTFPEFSGLSRPPGPYSVGL